MTSSMRFWFGSAIALGICSCVTGVEDEGLGEVDEGGDAIGSFESALSLPITPVADATVQSANASANYGNASSLQADLDGSAEKRAYLRFAVPEGTFTSAKLRLYVTLSSANAADVYQVSNATWSESAITWNTRPAVDGPLLGSFTKATSSTWVELDVTQAVRAGQPLSLALIPRSADSAGFGSSERATGKPELVLVRDETPTEPPPEDPEEPTDPEEPPPVVAGTTCPESGYVRLVSVSTASQLASAFTNAQPGDQIRLAAGTYTGETRLTRNGTATNPITVCGMPGVWPVMHGNFRLSGAFITIAGIVFEGPNAEQNNIYMASPHDILFTKNIVRNGKWHAGIAVEGSYNVAITHNYIHDNGLTDIDHGIYYRMQATTPTRRNLIANNVIVGNASRGISMHDNNAGAVNYTTVVHNTITRNGDTGILLALNAGTGNLIANNVVAENARVYHHKQIRYKHGTGNTIANNIAWSSIANDSGMEPMGNNTVTGNVIQDPQFVDALTDFHLRGTSPAIGLGLPGYVTTDFDGGPRDSQPDAGAYEY